MEALRCLHCGANAASPTARFCEYCGNSLASDPFRQPTPDESLQQRFEELENHPELQRHLKWTPGPEVLARQRGHARLLVLFIVILCAVFAFQGRLPMPVFPLILVAILIARSRSRRRSAGDGPLERLVALVADERQDDFGRDESHRGTEYFATLETRDGARRELEMARPLAGEIHPGDMGVAYVQGGVLVAFRRLRA